MNQIGNIAFGKISNVRKLAEEDGVYFADVEIQVDAGFPAETVIYCARSDDYALSGRWVYQQIVDGNFEGEIRQLAPRENPVTHEIMPDQPVADGVQTL
jgi:hypothetical protein